MSKRGFFNCFDDTELDVLLKYCTLSKVAAEDVILSQGQADEHHVYMIVVGKVAVVMDGEEGPVTLGILENGELFGEFSLFTREARSATVIAMEDTEVLHIDLRHIDGMFEAHARVAYKLIKLIADQACRKLAGRFNRKKQPGS